MEVSQSWMKVKVANGDGKSEMIHWKVFKIYQAGCPGDVCFDGSEDESKLCMCTLHICTLKQGVVGWKEREYSI